MDRTCIICNRVIDPDRIEAVPETGLCIEHGKRAAELGGEFLLLAGIQNNSKQGSLKKNYSSVSGVSKFANDAVINRIRKEYEATCTVVQTEEKPRPKPKKPKPKNKQQDKEFDDFGEKAGTKRSAINCAILAGARSLSTIVYQSGQSKKDVVRQIGYLVENGLVELNKRNEVVPAKKRRKVYAA